MVTHKCLYFELFRTRWKGIIPRRLMLSDFKLCSRDGSNIYLW